MRKALVLVVLALALTAGLVAAQTRQCWDCAPPLFWLVRLKLNPNPGEVVVRRVCAAQTLDAVYIALTDAGSVSISTVPGGCKAHDVPEVPPEEH